MLGKIEGRKRRGRQRMRWLDGITDSMDMSLSIPWIAKNSSVCGGVLGEEESKQMHSTESIHVQNEAQVSNTYVVSKHERV